MNILILLKKNNIQGKVVIRFIVDERGAIDNIEVLKGIGYGCDEQVVNALKNLPNKFNPGRQNNVPVRVYYNLPVKFKLDDQENNTQPDSIHTVAWQKAEYPGGTSALRNFIYENITYPELAVANRIEGEVTVNFIIDEEGRITDITIVKGLKWGIDAEVVKVLKFVPYFFNPARQYGKRIKSDFTLTVTFKL